MQSQMIGMQSSLDRILSAIQTQQANGGLPVPQHAAAPMYPPAVPGDPSCDGPGMPPRNNGFDFGPGPSDRAKSFPPLPGFAPPVRWHPLHLVHVADMFRPDGQSAA